MLKEGIKCAGVGRQYGITETTVRYIKRDEQNTRATTKVTFNKTAKRVVIFHNKAIVKMESALTHWISECRSRILLLLPTPSVKRSGSCTVSLRVAVTTQATLNQDYLRHFSPNQPNLTSTGADLITSEGGSTLRVCLCTEKLHLQTNWPLGSAWTRHSRPLPGKEDIRVSKLCNMDETGLFWKCIPLQTFIMMEVRVPGFKV